MLYLSCRQYDLSELFLLDTEAVRGIIHYYNDQYNMNDEPLTNNEIETSTDLEMLWSKVNVDDVLFELDDTDRKLSTSFDIFLDDNSDFYHMINLDTQKEFKIYHNTIVGDNEVPTEVELVFNLIQNTPEVFDFLLDYHDNEKFMDEL